MTISIDHFALYVCNLENAKEFFVKYFQAIPNALYQNEKTGFSSYFLSFDNGSRIEIMHRPLMEENNRDEVQLGYHHVAFHLGSKESVDELTERLYNDGYQILIGPRTTGDGYYESCVVGFENNIIEMTV